MGKKGKRSSPVPLLSNVFFFHHNTLKTIEVTKSVKDTDYLALTILRTISKRASSLRSYLFHEVLQPTLDEIRKSVTKAAEKPLS